MRTIEERFARATRHLPREKAYLAGVSGGRDSAVLLQLLKVAGFQNVTVCHFNHGIRKEAEQDLERVRDLAKISYMRFISDKMTDFGGIPASEGRMREHRLRFFGRCVVQTGATGVFLGHHADDQAETVLWNLLRGAGAEGLCGMAFHRELPTSDGAVAVYRPLLEVWRREIDAYVEEHSISFVDDSTNNSPAFTRNRLRHEVIPWLEKTLGRNIRENLLRTASILAEENEYLDSLATVPDGTAPLSVAALNAQPVALQRRIVLRWLRFHQIADVGFEEVERVRALLDLTTGPARCNLPENRQARRRAGKISLAWQTEKPV